jgi:hypothetical protein
MKRTITLIGIILAIALAVTAVYMKGIYDGGSGKGLTIAEAVESSKWSPTKPYPKHETRCESSLAAQVCQCRGSSRLPHAS